MYGGPEVEDVAFGSARRMKTLKDLLAEVDGERALPRVVGVMDWAGAASLRARSAQAVETAQVCEHLFHTHVGTQSGKIDRDGPWRWRNQTRRERFTVVFPRREFYAGIDRGDHFPFRT